MLSMAGPLVGAKNIYDKEGNRYMACPACGSVGCPACNSKGRVRIFPIEPATAYAPGTFVSQAEVAASRALPPVDVSTIVHEVDKPGAIELDGLGFSSNHIAT